MGCKDCEKKAAKRKKKMTKKQEPQPATCPECGHKKHIGQHCTVLTYHPYNEPSVCECDHTPADPKPAEPFDENDMSDPDAMHLRIMSRIKPAEPKCEALTCNKPATETLVSSTFPSITFNLCSEHAKSYLKTGGQPEPAEPQAEMMPLIDLSKIEDFKEGDCFNCLKNNSQSCGFGKWTSNSNGSDFDCEAPDSDNIECPCYHTWCNECQASKDGLKARINAILGYLNADYKDDIADITDNTVEAVDRWLPAHDQQVRQAAAKEFAEKICKKYKGLTQTTISEMMDMAEGGR
jgi:hypothetical protein